MGNEHEQLFPGSWEAVLLTCCDKLDALCPPLLGLPRPRAVVSHGGLTKKGGPRLCLSVSLCPTIPPPLRRDGKTRPHHTTPVFTIPTITSKLSSLFYSTCKSRTCHPVKCKQLN
jgi:hypothetical protein